MKNRLLLLIILLGATTLGAATPAPRFQAGAATSNITPLLGTKIVGGFAPYPAEHVHDELHARCLVLDDGQTRIALVVCDVLGMNRSVSIEARRLIQEATGIPPGNVMISATHTHSAGSAVGENRFVNEQVLDEYQIFLARRIADGVRRAVNVLRPAQIAFGTAEAPEHLNNRRWFMREGKMPPNPFGKIDKVKMNPPAGSPDLLEPAGPTDPTISFIALREPNGRLLSVYTAYSLHYVGGTGGAEISADYFGMYCEELKRLQGATENDPPFVAMMANGTSGDVNNTNFRQPRPAKPKYQQMRYVAHDVAGKVHAALARVTWKDGAELAARFREPEIPWRQIDAEMLAWAKNVEATAPRIAGGNVVVGGKFATTPQFVQPLSYAGRVQLLAQAAARQPALVPLQILRIGDICIGSMPCETFTEIGLEFKQRNPLPHGFLVSIAHGYIGYLPTPRHHPLGGYETWPGTNYLEPQASVKMLDALMAMAKEVAPKGR